MSERCVSSNECVGCWWWLVWLLGLLLLLLLLLVEPIDVRERAVCWQLTYTYIE